MTNRVYLLQGTSTENRKKLESYEYIVIAHFSHGTTDGYAAINDENDLVSLRDLYLVPLFEVPELHDKLKWIVVQTCRRLCDTVLLAATGGVEYTRWYACSVSSWPGKLYGHLCFVCSNLLCISYTGAVSYRCEVNGSLYIQELSEAIRTLAATSDLVTILTTAEERVAKLSPDWLEHEREKSTESENVPEEGAVQEPMHYRNLPSYLKFYFTTGFIDERANNAN